MRTEKNRQEIKKTGSIGRQEYKMNELGNWISQGTQKPFYVRKEFDVKKEIVKAAAYVCGLGQFIFHLNGQKVADHELDPDSICEI